MTDDTGLRDLVDALDAVRDDYGLTSASGSRELPDGHTLTLRVFGDLIELEREDGTTVVVPRDAVT